MKIKKITNETPCYECNQSIRGKSTERNKCKACNGIGKYKEEHYHHIVKAKNGQQYCFDGDTIK